MIDLYDDDDLNKSLTVLKALNYIGNKIKPSKGFVLVCPELFRLLCEN
jgi:hypothetical protein